jgi:hypothetical protein
MKKMMENEMSYKKDDVVSVITNAGEYVGKFKSEGDSTFAITKPRMLISGEGGVGFARGICVTGNEDAAEITFQKTGVVFTTPTSDVVEKAYVESTTSIVLDAGGIQV